MPDTPREALALNHEQAKRLVQRLGIKKAEALLEKADVGLTKRLAALKPEMRGSFSETQMRTTQAQLQQVIRELTQGMSSVLMRMVEPITEHAVEGTVEYLQAADGQFRGTGTQPLALDESLMMDRAYMGANSSLLNRIASNPDGPKAQKYNEDVDAIAERETRAKEGILERYGQATIEQFEAIMQQGIVQRKSWAEIQLEITEANIIGGRPSFWAERIVRTEGMGIYGKAQWEATREADEQLGDMIRINSAVFDDRTSADSYAVHGQVRRVDEPFQSWYGLFMHPPDRPLDRSLIVPSRLSWDFPPELLPRSNGEVAERWRNHDKRKAPVPPRPLMTTVSIPGVRFPE